jgi:hypothetical protein
VKDATPAKSKSAKTSCPNRERNNQNCPCTCDECERHGVCCECVAFHRGRGDRPACLR